jgi:hypothetical protein
MARSLKVCWGVPVVNELYMSESIKLCSWWWQFTLGSTPYSPNAPKPYRQALHAPQSDISSVQPYPFTRVPDGPQTYNLNVLWVQERNPNIQDVLKFKNKFGSLRVNVLCVQERNADTLPFSIQKVAASESPPCSPMDTDTHLQYIFTSVDVSLYHKGPKKTASLHVP